MEDAVLLMFPLTCVYIKTYKQITDVHGEGILTQTSPVHVDFRLYHYHYCSAFFFFFFPPIREVIKKKKRKKGCDDFQG